MAADPELTSTVRRQKPAWSVNAVAQSAGIAALEDGAHMGATREVVSEAKEFIRRELDAMGVAVTPSAANFMLVRVGDAAMVRGKLLRRRIAVGDCASFGLPAYIRIAVRRPEECAQLVEALGGVLGDE